MTRAELANFNGQNGQPAYVAVSGKIYNVSSSSRWQNGLHEGAHQAGQDLTEALKSAPHVKAVMERFPVVGKLEEQAPEPEKSKKPVWLLAVGVALLLTILALLIF